MEISKKSKSIKNNRLAKHLPSSVVQQLFILATWIALLIIFSLADPHFMKMGNIVALLLASAVTGIQALGVTFAISTGGIDITPGLGMAMTGVITAMMMVTFHLPIWVAVLIGILSGAVLGWVNGLLIAGFGMQPMIATLAMMLVCQGVALILSGSKPVYTTDQAGFDQIARGTQILGIPNAVWIFLLVAVLSWIILNKTRLGRYALAMGSNEEATRMSGVNVRRWKWGVYVLTGCFTGLSGVVMASRLSAAQPATGQGYEMYAIAAAVIGGASLTGGRASIVGTVLGALIITTINNGLQILSVPDPWQKVFLGVVVIVAVLVDVYRQHNQQKAK
ncbi:ABC transporter permease [Bifidobacterium sp. ESL0775]|uniref:ABC transporter permease n=1 Tax=Bifidobacterium sp. ESL0775 TaxID=2983230 RepID=UPI0023F65631|nr:ABC transporter permease [Bifidobacterium sp. ESL0775]WEV69872.1 ABC transporter permease [Bifidobacterium sp. ESL0775]